VTDKTRLAKKLREASGDEWGSLHAIRKQVTAAVRVADGRFESGGGTRDWVRECLLPALQEAGLVIVPSSLLNEAATAIADDEVKR